MSTQRRVQVVFEAVLNNFTHNVREAARTTLEVGEAGRRASRDVDFREPTRSSGRFEDSLRGLVNRFRGVSQGGREASGSTNFTESTNSAEGLNSALERTTGIMKKLAGMYIGKQVLGFAKEKLTSNLNTFMDLETGMREVYTLLPEMSEESFGKMTDDLKKFSIDMATLPEESIPALYSAISAGVSEETVFNFLETAGKAAVGGVTDLETSVDVLTSVVNAYGEETLNAKEASDLMFMAVVKGKTSFPEMASYLYSVIPIAQSANVAFGDITAAISTMSAKGTRTRIATTQISSSIEELSRQGTKASDIFNEMTGKTFKQFMQEGYNLQDAFQVMEQGAKHLNLEISDLFSSADAGKAALTLTGEGTQKFTSDLESMEDATGSADLAFEKMNSTLKVAVDGIRSRMQVFAWDIAGQYVPEVKEAVDGLSSTFDNLSADGTLDRLGQSIGGIVVAIINQINNLLSNADKIISVIDTIAYHIENNMGTIISVIKTVIGAFLGFKTIGGVVSIVNTLIDVFLLLGNAFPYVIGAAQVLWGVLVANPIILVIGLVIALIVYLFNLSQGFETLGEFGLFVLEALKFGFYAFAEVVWEVIAFILDKLELLLGWIPLVGDAVRGMSSVAQSALAGFDEALAQTASNMNALRSEASKGIHIPVSIGEGVGKPNYNDALKGMKVGNVKVPSPTKTLPNLKMPSIKSGSKKGAKSPSLSGSKGKSATPKKVTITDKISSTKDKTQNQIDMYDSRAELARARKDRSSEKKNLNHMLYVMNKQAKDLLVLQNKSKGAEKNKVETERNKLLAQIAQTTEEIRKSYIDESIDKIKEGFQTGVDLYTSRAEVAEVKENNKSYRENLNHALWEMTEQAKELLGLQNKSTGKDKSIVEIARNKLLVEIARVTEDIKNGINKMVGEFNVPSELRKLTEYQYKVQNSSGVLTKQLVVSPDIRMYLTVQDTDGKGADQVQQEIKAFTSAIFQKDDLVSLFTRDVTRN